MPQIHKLCGIILPGRSDDFQARAEKDFLLPFREPLRTHGRASLQIHGKTGAKIHQPRTIYRVMLLLQLALECSDSVWQRDHEVGGAAEEAEGMVKAETCDAVCSGRTRYGNGAVKIHSSTEIGPR